jgi:STE24 endopeptidase
MALSQGLLVPLVCLVVYFGVFFGFISRRFERQADIYGCRAVSCGRPDCPENHSCAADQQAGSLCPIGIQIFVGALEKIARLSGSVRETRSWRHFSIAKRVEFLESLVHRPELERSFQRIVLLLKILVLLALLGGIWLAVHQSQAAGELVVNL